MNSYEWTGKEVTPEIAVKVIETMHSHLAFPDEDITQTVYRVIMELITNVGEHAYPDNFSACSERGWTVKLAEVEPNIVSLIVKDAGITIPKSILAKMHANHPNNAHRYEEGADDTALIAEAIRPKGDAWLPSFRGKGLSAIATLVETDKLLTLCIQSRSGVLRYKKGVATVKESLEVPFVGTSVEVEIATTGAMR